MNRSTFSDNGFPALSTPSRAVAISGVTLLTIGIAAGTIGNLGVCVFIGKRHDLRRVPHYLLASLSFTSLFSSLITMPANLAMVIGYFPVGRNLSSREMVCKIGFSSSMGCTVVNAFTLSLMAIDRQDCVIRPFKRRLSPQNVKKVIFVTWAVAFLLALLHGIILSKETSVCSRLDPYNSFSTSASPNQLLILYTMVLSTIPNIITVMVIVITIFRIVKKLRSSLLPRLNSLQRQRENKLTKVTYNICSVFLISWFPIIISNSIVRVGGFHGPTIQIIRLFFSVILVNFNYVANPVLHCKMLKITKSVRYLKPELSRQKAQNVQVDTNV